MDNNEKIIRAYYNICNIKPIHLKPIDIIGSININKPNQHITNTKSGAGSYAKQSSGGFTQKVIDIY